MIPSRKNISRIYLAAVLCLVPLICGCQRISARFIGVQSLDISELTTVLARKPAPLIVDLRSEAEYLAGHLPGSIRLPLGGIDGYFARSGHSPQRDVVVICQSGWDSQVAASTIAAAGFVHVYSLNSGLAGLKSAGFAFDSGPGPDVPAAILRPPVIPISTISQLAVTMAAFVVKPVYMLISILIIVVLWRQHARELILLRFAMVSFVLGEGACAVNYLAAENAGLWLEFLHGAGMVGTYTLVFGSLFVFFDEQILHYSAADRRCNMQRFCRHCWKNETVECGLFRIGLIALPMFAVCALLPVTMPIRPYTMIMPVFDSDVLWIKDFWNLLIEFRVYPILGACCALLSFLIFRRGKDAVTKAQPLLFLSVGFTGYAFFRFGLLLTFGENQGWADWWEELSELMLVVLIWGFLVVYRRSYSLKMPASVVRFTNWMLPS